MYNIHVCQRAYIHACFSLLFPFSFSPHLPDMHTHTHTHIHTYAHTHTHRATQRPKRKLLDWPPSRWKKKKKKSQIKFTTIRICRPMNCLSTQKNRGRRGSVLFYFILFHFTSIDLTLFCCNLLSVQSTTFLYSSFFISCIFFHSFFSFYSFSN